MGTRNTASVSRRALWTRESAEPSAAIPPPWTDAATLAAACTRCGACANVCPERIIAVDASGLPNVDFEQGGCTFCGTCADICPAPVFDRRRPKPWNVTARVHSACLAARGIVCQSCRDACPANAIQFRARPGGVSLPAILSARCTGCGFCASVCPADAIEMAEAAHAS